METPFLNREVGFFVFVGSARIVRKPWVVLGSMLSFQWGGKRQISRLKSYLGKFGGEWDGMG